ncbi:MAG: MoxR family ATPase [Nitrososphaerota archaeon]|nr:MoxR family ATPase [Candidatus Brockarchaeota archaeon]
MAASDRTLMLQKIEEFKKEVHKAVVGYDDIIDGLLIALVSGGHVLLEGVPGIAKTLLAKSFAQALSLKFSRVQFTPDLVPSDITGTSVFDQKRGEFRFKEGPVFTNVLLADEINRSPPKVQSALLECMQEKYVTADGKSYPLPDPFFVIATQNPIEMEGVYPLPEAQVDRFMFKLVMKYPSREEEKIMLSSYVSTDIPAVNPVLDVKQLQTIREEVRKITMESKVFDYILDIVEATRKDERVMLGASPRASLQMALASRVRALIKGRNYVSPSDVKSVAPNILRHRIILKPEAELDGLKTDILISELLEKVPVPKLV